MFREMGRFTAQGDDGKSYVVLIRAEVLDSDPSAGDAPANAITRYELTDGTPVKRVQKGEYEVAGVTLKSSDPAAH